MRRHLAYLKYVLRHKWFVLLAGLKLGVPLWNLIFHDWTKFLPIEWFPYARCFYKPNGEHQYKESPEFAVAWNHHQKRNRHHYQHWRILWDRGEDECLPMPERDWREMLADWMGAGRALGKPDTAAWYRENYDKIKLHPETRRQIDTHLLPANDPLYMKGTVQAKWTDAAEVEREIKPVITLAQPNIATQPDIKFWQGHFSTDWNPIEHYASIVPKHLGADPATGPDPAPIEARLSLMDVLGDVSHTIWSDWMRWQLGICEPGDGGTIIIPKDKVERWRRQLNTDYVDLSQNERDSDIEQAEKIIRALDAAGYGIARRY